MQHPIKSIVYQKVCVWTDALQCQGHRVSWNCSENHSYVILISNRMGYATVKLTECPNDVTKLCWQCWRENCSIRAISPIKWVLLRIEREAHLRLLVRWSNHRVLRRRRRCHGVLSIRATPSLWTSTIVVQHSNGRWCIEVQVRVLVSSRENVALEYQRMVSLFFSRRSIEPETLLFHSHPDVVDRLYPFGRHHCSSEQIELPRTKALLLSSLLPEDTGLLVSTGLLP